MINIEINAPDINDIKARLGQFPNRSHVILYRSVNRTVTHTKSTIAKQASLRYIIKQKTVKSSLSSSKATRNNPVSLIKSKGGAIPLFDFDINPRRKARKLKNGSYSPTIYKSRVLRKSGLVGVERMFIAKNQVLIRPENATREENRNIKNWLRLALSVPQMISNEKIIDDVKFKSMKMLRERVDHEIEYELRRLQN